MGGCGSGKITMKKVKEGDSNLNLFLIFDTEFKCENAFDSHIKTKARMRDRTSQR